jgi:hypothetical protein
MSWQMAVVGAIGATQYQQQGAIGQYNQAVQDRKAAVLEQESAFDISQFDKQFQKLEGETKVNLSKSGVVQGSGTAYRIQMQNAREAELQRNIMRYNSKVAANKKMEEASFARVSGQLAYEQAKLAQINTIASTGTSLLTMSSGSPTKTDPGLVVAP